MVYVVPLNHDCAGSGPTSYWPLGLDQTSPSGQPGGFYAPAAGAGPYSFNAGDTVCVYLSIDGYLTPGDLIADAVKLTPTTGTPIIIDNNDRGGSNTVFTSNNWIDRNFLDMQDEDPVNHAAYSKVPFFINSGCGVGNYYAACYDPNDFTNNTLTAEIDDNLALLYGMTHGGLISFTSAVSYPARENNASYYSWSTFTSTIAGPSKTFGDGSLALANETPAIPYVLIGAGTLKASAYIPYGTTMQTLAGITISTTGQLYSYPGQLIWMEDFTVTAAGGCTVQGNEVRVYAESDLKGEVDLKSGI